MMVIHRGTSKNMYIYVLPATSLKNKSINGQTRNQLDVMFVLFNYYYDNLSRISYEVHYMCMVTELLWHHNYRYGYITEVVSIATELLWYKKYF